MKDYILSTIARDPALQELQAGLSEGRGPIAVFSLPEAARGAVFAALGQGGTCLIVVDRPAAALELYQELKSYREDVQLFLPRELPLSYVQAADPERRSQRLGVLSRLVLGMDMLCVTCPQALMERLAPREAFVAHVKLVKRGDTVPPRELLSTLVAAGYERVDMLEGPGQVALRGDILDVFPPQGEDPCRIEFFDDEVDQLRYFDVTSQRSVAQTDRVLLPPAFETPQPKARMRRGLQLLGESRGFDREREDWAEERPTPGADVLLPLLYEESATLGDYLPMDCRILALEPDRLMEEGRTARGLFLESVAAMLERGEGHSLQEKLMEGEQVLQKLLVRRYTGALYALFRTSREVRHRMQVSFDFTPAPAYLGDMGELIGELKAYRQAGGTALLFGGQSARALMENLQDELRCVLLTAPRAPEPGEVLIIEQSLPRGFVCPSQKLMVLTGAELFGKKMSRPKKKRSGLQFSDLTVGDYVVHEAHGVGRFVGVEQLSIDGSTRDFLLLVYKGGDKLFIPTDQLDRIQKYMGTGGEEAAPTLSKLGGGEWQQKVQKARTAAKKLAVDLAALYARRTSLRGHAFSPDTAWQQKLEAAFPYEETRDQLRCIREVKADMESPRPMDRLLCGDVGYGKTEVALRAAFKAVQDGKQAALLVPTTILAQQHFANISQRFASFPVNCACLSRFQSPKEREKIKVALAKGEIDFVVGTHALLAKDVKFKDLGLLIIDEEHRFGVNHKEQIKALRAQVDVLTMTATPIPRTLNMAMTGVRDVSVIETPPENRFPVQTFVVEYTDAQMAAVIRRELGRGGQCFIISNNVKGMESILSRFEALVPEARFLMAHGQMNERTLEQTMLSFIAGEADVLLCSTIVESGVDIPNCNTLIVLDADKLGLAQLYQLRGRVGRSHRIAYAYFTVPQRRLLPEAAQKRLLAIREFTQFGAGYRLAMRDLEIRGAGSLLGAEQHGHLSDVGYEYYCKLIRQAVDEATGKPQIPLIDTAVDAPGDAFVPKTLVNGELQRMAMYKRIAEIADQAAFDDLYDEFTDRYGDLPESVERLMRLSLIKHLAGAAGFAAVTVRTGKVTLQYDPSARVEGGKLLLALTNQEGARLKSGTPTAVELAVKGRSADEFVKKLPQFLSILADCNLSAEGL
ncbi:MAG: transcription-repair coupling factor [Clostridia bacterium]|nr:transcription-repair coupling factor [Clostridia bacterium]